MTHQEQPPEVDPRFTYIFSVREGAITDVDAVEQHGDDTLVACVGEGRYVVNLDFDFDEKTREIKTVACLAGVTPEGVVAGLRGGLRTYRLLTGRAPDGRGAIITCVSEDWQPEDGYFASFAGADVYAGPDDDYLTVQLVGGADPHPAEPRIVAAATMIGCDPAGLCKVLRDGFERDDARPLVWQAAPRGSAVAGEWVRVGEEDAA